MPTEVIMPKVDMDMASGKIIAWYVDEGGTVDAGAALFEIETDKSAMEIEAPASGILHHRTPEGMEVPIGQPCGWLYAEGEAVGDPPGATAPEAPATPEAETPRSTKRGVTQAEAHSDKPRATPRARGLAAARGVGPGGDQRLRPTGTCASR